MTKKNEVISKEESNEAFSVKDEKLMSQMQEDSKQYEDDTKVTDTILPRIKILQSNSAQIKKSDPAYAKGAEEGDIFNTLTEEFMPGEKGILLVPCKRRIVYLEWKDIKEGGGLVKNYEQDSKAYEEASVDDMGRHMSEEGNAIVKTYETYGFIVNVNKKEFTPIVLSMSRSQVSKMKKFNSLIRGLCDKETGKQLVEWAGVYRISTIPQKNERGSWYNYEVKPAGYTLGIPDIGQKIYDECKKFREIIESENVKIEPEKSQKDQFIDTKEETKSNKV